MIREKYKTILTRKYSNTVNVKMLITVNVTSTHERAFENHQPQVNNLKAVYIFMISHCNFIHLTSDLF